MNPRYLALVALLTIPAWAACGEEPAAQPPPQPSAAPAVEPAPPPAVVTAEPTPPPAEPAPPPAPPPKPGKEKIVGKWQFSFEGDPKAKAEEAAKKKFPKDKDQAKRDAFVQKIAEEAALEWIEFAEGHYVSHTTPKGKDKIILKVKYEIGSDDNTKIGMKPSGKDEISKKELKNVEWSITFTDDNTIAIVDPKKGTLVFKRK
jgi:type IV secretory pathway VirB10-like protein